MQTPDQSFQDFPMFIWLLEAKMIEFAAVFLEKNNKQRKIIPYLENYYQMCNSFLGWNTIQKQMYWSAIFKFISEHQTHRLN